MKEIVTVQIGSFANFIGSHFWNYQDEMLGLASHSNSDPVFKDLHKYVNMDVLYRAGENYQGVFTYTPRVITIDYQGALGSMTLGGGLYDDCSNEQLGVSSWSGDVSTEKAQPRKKNLFLQRLHDDETKDSDSNGEIGAFQDEDIIENLEKTVEFWTDYSKVHYHPHSFYELCGLWMDPLEFDHYGIGSNVYSEGQRGEEMNDKLRFFVEECDHIQGFQFFVGNSGGFSSIAADFLEQIADDYPNTPILLYNVMDPASQMGTRTRNQSTSRKIQDAVSFSRLSSFSDMIVPVGLPLLSRSKASSFLQMRDESNYHCSAVYAAAFHSVSLPFRMEQLGSSTCVSGATDMNLLVQRLTAQARQNGVVVLDLAFPPPTIPEKQDERQFLDCLGSLTPEINDADDVRAIESVTVHGALMRGGAKASVEDVIEAVNDEYEKSAAKPKLWYVTAACCPLAVPLPFPRMFGGQVGKNGQILSGDGGGAVKGSLEVHSVPLATRLRSSKAVLPFLERRLADLRRFGTGRGAPGSELLRSWGYGKDDALQLEDMLCKLVSTLDDRADVSSDSD